MKPKEDSEVIYMKKRLNIFVPQMADHAAKNPFFVYKKRGAPFIIRCTSLYKSHLKNKSWNLVKVEKPSIPELDPNGYGDSPQDLEPTPAIHAKRFILDRTEVFKEFETISKLSHIDKNSISQRKIVLKGETGKKTLLLDLDGTLVKAFPTPPKGGDHQKIHVRSGGTGKPYSVYVKLRPHLKYFLHELSELFEMVVFTSGEKEYANAITYEILDKERKLFTDILSRNHCIPNNGNMIKDLRVIANRDMKDMVIIDDSLVSFCVQISNGILVPEYCGDDEDTTLRLLVPLLKDLAECGNAQEYLKNEFLLRELYNEYIETDPGTECKDKESLRKRKVSMY